MAIMTTVVKTQIMMVPAREAKNRFGELLDRAQRAPVTIGKHGRPFAVVLAGIDFENYNRFRKMEDHIWGERAIKADHGDKWLGPEKSAAFLKEMLNAKTRR
jgi:antitoxin Phd